MPGSTRVSPCIMRGMKRNHIIHIWLGIIAFFVMLLIIRLTWLQVFQTDQFQIKAERNRVWKVIMRAPRGRILDRNGVVLADNAGQYSWIYEEGGQRREQVLSTELALERIATAAAQVRLNYRRVYPYGPILAHLVGYVQAPFTGDDVVIGQTGLERVYNQQLAGTDGLQVYERDAMGRPTRLTSQQSAEKGQDIQLSIDAELSRVAFAALGSRRGAVIVTEPKTGQVLAMVSKPSYVPVTTAGELDDGESTSFPSEDQKDETPVLWEAELRTGQVAPSIAAALEWSNTPFLFRPIGAVYAPGSVFKIITSLAGLEYEAFSADTTVVDEGVLKVGEYEYGNWYWRQYGRTEGTISLVRALARSNDIYFYKAAEWIGPQRLADFARLLNLGKKTGIELPGEQSGLVPDPAWKQQYFGEMWYLGNTYHMGIGQGDVLVTPVQLQSVMSLVAARGRLCRPLLVMGSTPVCQELSLQSESLDVVKQGLREACSTGGTGFPFFDSEYEVLCKTGTAEFGAANERGVRATNGWFTVALTRQLRSDAVAIGDLQPEVVITVLVESDEENMYQEGSGDAGPVARAVADWWWGK
jgi:penicillin-binding protein 2